MAGRRIDVALFDDEMPGATGVDLLQRIRQQPDLSGFPVVLMSTIDKVKQNKKNVAVGFSNVLMKPARRDQLVTAIASSLRRARNSSGSQAVPENTVPILSESDRRK